MWALIFTSRKYFKILYKLWYCMFIWKRYSVFPSVSANGREDNITWHTQMVGITFNYKLK